MRKSQLLITTLLMLIIPETSNSAQLVQTTQTYSQIIKNNPSIDKDYAHKLSKIINKVSIKYSINSKLFTAMLMQESRYELNSKNCHLGFRHLTDTEKQDEILKCDELPIGLSHNQCQKDLEDKLTEDKVCSDFGIAMINIRTIYQNNLKVEKLTTDLEYSVNAGAKVLALLQRQFGDKDSTFWTLYNAKDKTKRELYRRLVERWY